MQLISEAKSLLRCLAASCPSFKSFPLCFASAAPSPQLHLRLPSRPSRPAGQRARPRAPTGAACCPPPSPSSALHAHPRLDKPPMPGVPGRMAERGLWQAPHGCTRQPQLRPPWRPGWGSSATRPSSSVWTNPKTPPWRIATGLGGGTHPFPISNGSVLRICRTQECGLG